MDPKNFKDPRAGSVLRAKAGHWTFLPAPMSFDFAMDSQTALLLSEADAALGELSGLGRHLPNPELLIAPYSRREAVLSSRIEGTQASLSDLFFDELHHGLRDSGKDVYEVRNYLRALRKGIEKLTSLPIASRLLRDLHRELMSGTRGEEKTPGEFRTSQNWIGPSGSTPATAPYVPPPAGEPMLNALADWEKFVNQRGKLPDLIQCALMHERIEAIHPFLDGNGRVGRLLIALFLIERKRLAKPLLYLSAYIEQNKQDYYDLLQRVRTDYDRRAWVQFFLLGISQTARQAVRHADALMELRAAWRGKLTGKHRARTLVDSLFSNPYVTATGAGKLLSVTAPTAAKTIEILRSRGILEELTGRQWGKIYVARELLKAIDEPPAVETPTGIKR